MTNTATKTPAQRPTISIQPVDYPDGSYGVNVFLTGLTSPAHAEAPDEPAYWLEADESARGADPRDVFGKDSMRYNNRLSKTKPSGRNPFVALYLHPAPNAITELCQNAVHMGEHACANRRQCWEPCGELGHSAEHAKRADGERIGDGCSCEPGDCGAVNSRNCKDWVRRGGR